MAQEKTPPLDEEENLEEIKKKIQIGKEELEKTYKSKNTELIQELRADLASNLGILYEKLDEFDQAKHYLQLALVEYGQLDLKQKIAAVKGSLGALYLKNTEYRMALKFYEDSYDFWKNTNFLNERIICLQNLGIIHLKMDDEDQASEYIFEALKKAIKLQDETQFAFTIDILINHYEKQQRFDIIYELKKKALEFWEKTNIPDRLFKTLIDLGVLCQILEDFQQALTYFKKGFNVAYNLNNLEKMFIAQGFIAEVYINLKEIEKGKHTYIQAFKLAVYINTYKDFQQHIDEMRSSLLVLGIDKEIIDQEEQIALKEANNH